MRRPKLLLFDVNGTLLDTQGLAPALLRIFGTRIGVREFFLEVLQYSMALTLAGDFLPFGELAIAVLHMTASTYGIHLKDEEIESVRNALTSLPPFGDVERALEQLQAAGIRLAVLTNSAMSVLTKQLDNAKLTRFFEQALSVDRVRRFKPAPETYEDAAQALGLPAHQILMVAAHPWDLFGAMRVGFEAAFLARTEKGLFLHGQQPALTAPDLGNLAAQLLALPVA